MTFGTITSYDASRGTGTVTCASGSTFPFSSRTSLVLGERVRFLAVGGRAGTYALRVEPVASSRIARRAGQARRPVWQPSWPSRRMAA